MGGQDSQALLAGFRAGSLLAAYRLEYQVGAGGMAVVFRARDERLDRPVALKILAPGLAADAEFRLRFIAESRAAAVVDDPHIIPVYEAGEAGGVLFIAMRFVEGGDLRGVLDADGALPPDRATALISPVAAALDAAHRAGLVHRDVKPGNILVDAGEDRPEHVYLSDFGISKAVSSVGLTGPGLFVGTPDYAAPEQIQGRAVDGRADQYALACVAFQLLAGELPFRADRGIPVLLAHVTSPPPSLAARRPGLPAAVDEVMARALAKDPAERYASCLDFAGALREALGLPPFAPESSAAPPGVPRRVSSGRDTVSLAPAGAAGDGTAPTRPLTGWIRRCRRSALALAGAALAAAGAVALVLTSLVTSPAPAKSRTAAQSKAAVRPPAAAETVRATASGNPASTPAYTRVPVSLPARYRGDIIERLAFNPAGTRLAIASGKQVCLWDIATGTGCATSSAETAVDAVAFSPDGKTVAIGSGTGQVVLLKVSTMTRTAEFAGPAYYAVQSLAFSPDGRTLAAGDINGDSFLWDVATGKTVTLPGRKSQGVRTVAFSPDGKTLAAGDLNGSVYLWNVARGKPAGILPDPASSGVDSVAFSPDGKTLAAGDFNGHVFLWAAASGKLTTPVITDPGTVSTAYHGGVDSVAFSPDGKILATGDKSGICYLWEVAPRNLIGTLPIPNGLGVNAVAFSPDGKTLATGDLNGSLDLWHRTS